MKGTAKEDLFREAKYDRQMSGIINIYYTSQLTWSVLINVMCNIRMTVVNCISRECSNYPKKSGQEKQ